MRREHDAELGREAAQLEVLGNGAGDVAHGIGAARREPRQDEIVLIGSRWRSRAEYAQNDEPASLPTYRAYYPTRDTLRETLLRIVTNFQLKREFEDLVAQSVVD